MHAHTHHTHMLCFNAVLNNCHPNGVSLEQPPMCRGLSLWIITDLLSGPLMWEMYLIFICFRCLCCSCAFGLIHFIWRLTENPEPFISSSWKLRTTIPKPYVKRHHGVPFLIMLKNSLILSTELCVPLISALASAPHAQSSYTTSPSSQGPSCYSTV